MAENIQLKERTELLYKLSREYLDMKVYLGKMAQVGEVDLEQHQQNEQVSISEANDRVNPDTEGRPRSNSQGFQGFRRVNHQANSEGGSTTQFMPVTEQSVRRETPVNQRLLEIAAAPSDQDKDASTSGSKPALPNVRKPCHYFSNYGACHFEERTGRKCRFEHRPRSSQLCPNGMACNIFHCQFTHPNIGAHQRFLSNNHYQNQATLCQQQQLSNQQQQQINQQYQQVRIPQLSQRTNPWNIAAQHPQNIFSNVQIPQGIARPH